MNRISLLQAYTCDVRGFCYEDFAALCQKEDLCLCDMSCCFRLYFYFSTAVSLLIINSSIKPTLLNIAEMETNRIATHVIQEAVEDYMSQDENVKNLVEMKTNENGKVTTIDFNSHGLRGMHSKITKQLHEKLKETETEEFNSSAKTPEGKNDGVIYNIPLGQATETRFLETWGRKYLYGLMLWGCLYRF